MDTLDNGGHLVGQDTGCRRMFCKRFAGCWSSVFSGIFSKEIKHVPPEWHVDVNDYAEYVIQNPAVITAPSGDAPESRDSRQTRSMRSEFKDSDGLGYVNHMYEDCEQESHCCKDRTKCGCLGNQEPISPCMHEVYQSAIANINEDIRPELVTESADFSDVCLSIYDNNFNNKCDWDFRDSTSAVSVHSYGSIRNAEHPAEKESVQESFTLEKGSKPHLTHVKHRSTGSIHRRRKSPGRAIKHLDDSLLIQCAKGTHVLNDRDLKIHREGTAIRPDSMPNLKCAYKDKSEDEARHARLAEVLAKKHPRHGMVLDDEPSLVDANARFSQPAFRRQLSLPYRGTLKKAR